MNLAVDIGNSHIKFGLFKKNELQEVLVQPQDIREILSNNHVRHAIISKTGTDETVQAILKEEKIPTLLLSHQLKLPLHLLYKTPETLGADRIAGSVAANALYPESNVLKIDFGTCITYDFIQSNNEYAGGAISPGMMMRFKALHNYTAKLPLVDPFQSKAFDLTGTDTITSILSGVVNGIIGETEGIINAYELRFGNLKVVATGGDSGFFVTLVKKEIFASPYLVLEGLNTILNYNI